MAIASQDRCAQTRIGDRVGAPVRAAIVNSRITLVKILPRRASVAAFLCLIVAHLECPDMNKPSQERWQEQSGRPCRHILTAPLKSGNRMPDREMESFNRCLVLLPSG